MQGTGPVIRMWTSSEAHYLITAISVKVDTGMTRVCIFRVKLRVSLFWTISSFQSWLATRSWLLGFLQDRAGTGEFRCLPSRLWLATGAHTSCAVLPALAVESSQGRRCLPLFSAGRFSDRER